MNHTGENLLLIMVVILVSANLVGIGLPVWYKKDHEHHVNGTHTKNSNNTKHQDTKNVTADMNIVTGDTNIATGDTDTKYSDTSTKSSKTNTKHGSNTNNIINDDPNIINGDTNVINGDSCTVHVKIREGLWQRYCIESWREGKYCEIDVQEWCDNLTGPNFNSFVLSTQICGNLILLFAFGTILRSKCRRKEFNLEMVGTEIGMGGVLMILGGSVYAAADTGELNYRAANLHIGWGLCISVGIASILLCILSICQHVKETQRLYPVGYFPINDEDEELIVI